MVRNVSTEVLQILYCTELHGDAIIGCSWIGIHLSNPEMLLLIFPGPEIAEPAIPPKEEAANISQGKRMWGPVLFFHVQYDWVHSSSATIKITYSLHSFWMERHELYIFCVSHRDDANHEKQWLGSVIHIDSHLAMWSFEERPSQGIYDRDIKSTAKWWLVIIKI